MDEKAQAQELNVKALKKILHNYDYMNRMIVEELEIASEHGPLTGDYREQTWMDLFRRIIPKKYSLTQGVMIIDSFGNISKEVDIAVYDEQYTPYIFQYNALKFIPIEAVAVVIECKSTKWEEKNIKEWSDAIENLTPKASGIARMVKGYNCGITNKAQKKTRPIKILAAIKSVKEEKTAEAIKETFKDHFDFVIIEKINENNDKSYKSNGNPIKTLEILIKNEERSLGWWGQELNIPKEERTVEKILELDCLSNCESKEEKKSFNKKDYPELKLDDNNCSKVTLEDLKVESNPLLSLNFQLNQLLMLLNNPMLFPHFAYANTFNEIVKNFEKNNEEV